MKKILFFILFLLGKSCLIYSQCLISGISSTYCLNSSGSAFTLSPAGGSFTGSGIINSVFSPSLAGPGNHTLTYSYCSSTYSLEAPTFTQAVYVPTIVTLGDNQMSQAIPIGFPFRFFCQTYTDFYISSNGFISFSPLQTSGCCQGLPLPVASATNIIACAWTDLDPTQGGTIRYCLMGSAPNRAMLISFNCIFHKTDLAPVTSEIWLYESSHHIEISTVTKPVPAGSIQYPTTMGIQGSLNQFLVVPGRNSTSNWTATNELYRFIPGEECSLTQTVQVNVQPSLTVSTTNSLICKGETVTLTASGASTYLWNNSQSGSSVQVSPESNSTYTVVGTDNLGCASSSSIFVKVSACSSMDESDDLDLFKISVYPNPNTGEFSISSTKNARVKITNELGALIKLMDLCEENNYFVQVKGLIPGIYFISCDCQESNFYKKVLVID